MRSTALSALLLAACGLVFGKSVPDPARSIGVFLEFDETPSARVTAAMKNEVESIMGPLGLSFQWRRLGAQPPGSVFADLIVARFKGSCESATGPDLGAGDPTLGSTVVSEHGEVLHFTEIRCDTVRSYIAHDIVRLDQIARNAAYGRAMGRILAHEMYHIFADTEEHSEGGIARASYTPHDLIQPVFTFEPKEARMLRDYASRALGGREFQSRALTLAPSGDFQR